jgi:hypothetical protein
MGKPTTQLRVLAIAGALSMCMSACAAEDEGAGGAGGAQSTGGTLASGGSGGAGGASGAAGVGGSGGAGGSGGNATAGAGGMGAGGGGAGGMSSGGSGGNTGPLPASCAEAASAYTIATSLFDASLVPAAPASSWGGGTPRTPVAIDAASGAIYVGFTREAAGAHSVVIAREGAAAADVIEIPEATIGGVAATNDGVAALLFDPNPSTDDRVWAAVARFGAEGNELFKTDLFRSPNLEDEGTKGAPTTARFGYIADSDQLVAYFGHTQRYDDGVRHQGGYLATLDVSGTQDLRNGWFGSHNLDQRMLIDGDKVAVLGLGDAYPKGIFFSFIEEPRTNVIYSLAADGVGTTNGQLGGILDMGDSYLAPFITNRSVAQDLDAGTWPDIDETISMQIRDAAAAGTDIGLLPIPKSAIPDSDVTPIWLTLEVTSGARLGSLKSARYGSGEMILLAWSETTGDRRNEVSSYFTMIVDAEGAVCQPKTPLEAAHAFTDGDDLVRHEDGRIVWANVTIDRVQLVMLTP